MLAAIATPQVLVALLFVIFALGFLASGPRSESPPQVTIDLEVATAPLSEQEATLLIVDAAGVERATTVRLPLPSGATGRLATVLEHLRERSMVEGVWPPELPAPKAYVVGSGQRPVAVIDMQVPVPVGVSVEQEAALLRTLVGTALRSGAADVTFLRNGRPTDTLLGHVAVASGL